MTNDPLIIAGPPGLNAQSALDFVREWQRGAPEFIVQTSGSTGAPKPITLTRTQMEASAHATGAALGLSAGDRALVCLPTQYIAGRMMLVRGLVLGMSMIIVEPASDPFAALPKDAAFEFAAFVPLQLQTLLDVALVASSDSCFPEDTARAFRTRRLLEGMKAILVGGAAISTTLATQIRQLRVPVYHTYGMTETVTHVALKRLNGADESAAFVALPGVLLGLDDRGCLFIEGPMTAGARVQTNDLVELREGNRFVWIGRADNVINSGGVKVQIEVVEEAVAQVAAQQVELGLAGRRIFAGGVPDARLGEAVALVIEGAPLADDREEQLRWSLSQALPRYFAPRRILYAPHFVETPTGKIDRRTTLQGITAV